VARRCSTVWSGSVATARARPIAPEGERDHKRLGVVATSSVGGRSRVVIGVAILIAGSIAYGFLGTETQVDGARMGRLVVPTTRIAEFESHPLESVFEAPSKSSLSLVKQAGASHPTETGAYQVTWRAKTSKTDEASVLVQILPTPTLARSLQHELTNDYSEPKKLAEESLVLAHKFNVAVPGAFGASYAEKSSSSSSSSSTSVSVVLFHIHRVTVFILMEASNASIGEQDASSLATSEARHLKATEAGFSLASTVRPALLTLWYVLGTLAAVGFVLALPGIMHLITRRRERKEDRDRLRAQLHVRSRGSKVMQRQRAPLGSQRRPAKRGSR
jgi:hypothetical protein